MDVFDSVILGMGTHKANITDLGLENEQHNQAVFVVSNVEHDSAIADKIRPGKLGDNVAGLLENSVLVGDFVEPMQ